METMHRLSMEYALLKDREKRKKVVEEMDKLELEFSEANEKAQEYLDASKDECIESGNRSFRKHPSLSNYRKRYKEKCGTNAKGQN